MMRSLTDDLRYAVRQITKSPGFAAVAIITLALAIGANTAVFSVIDAVMLRPLPYDHPERLIEAQSVNTHNPSPGAISYPDFFDWRAQNRTLEHLVSYHDGQYTLIGTASPAHVDSEITSWDLLPTLGVGPELGRGFTADEEKRGSRVILISHALWQSQFGGDKSILGRSVNLSGNLYTIIGVMPASFRFPVTEPQIGVWTTLADDDDPNDLHPAITNRGSHFLAVFGRLKPGVTVEQANQDLNTIAHNLAKQYPVTNWRHDAARAQDELSSLVGDTRTALLIVLGAVALVLLIACGNIANLLLARMRERQREIAMRSALGAGRARLVRQLLVESLALSAAGGVVGCGLAYLCTPAILSLIGDSIPRALNAGVDLRVLGFAMGVAFAAGIVFGIVPALTASRSDLVSNLKEGSRTEMSGRDWLRSSLIVGQVALGLVLTAGAGLLLTSFLHLRNGDVGFDPDHLLTLFFETPDSHYRQTRPQFYRPYFEKVRALPGVQAAGGTMILPMSDDRAVVTFEDPEHPVPEGQQPSADISPVSPEYFNAMRIPLLEGRDFSDRDDMNAPPVMIVNQVFAQKFFPGENVVGKKLKPGAGNGTPGGPPWREIVGVVGNIKLRPTQREMNPAMYLSAAQMPTWCCLYTVVRSSVDPLSLEPSMRQIVSSLDKDIPVTEVRTMRDLMFRELAQPRFAMALLGAFAGLALVLTVVGLYGVMMYSVTRRTREIGVRMALGARRPAVLRMILRDAGRLLAIGVGSGLLATLLAASLLRSMLYGTGSRNPFVLGAVCLIVGVAGLIAAYIPALRAASIEPMEALRTE
ncbi:MAG: ABC transporter permease [Candidatus Korobacteraceae bacterium]